MCVMQLEEGVDTGPVFACERLPIGADQTADHLRAALVYAGTRLLVATLDGGLHDARPQEGEATYAAKVEADDLRLDWSRPAAELARVVRVGGAWTTFRGKRLKVLTARADAGPAAYRADAGPAADRAEPPGTLVAEPPGTLDGVRVATGDG